MGAPTFEKIRLIGKVSEIGGLLSVFLMFPWWFCAEHWGDKPFFHVFTLLWVITVFFLSIGYAGAIIKNILFKLCGVPPYEIQHWQCDDYAAYDDAKNKYENGGKYVFEDKGLIITRDMEAKTLLVKIAWHTQEVFVIKVSSTNHAKLRLPNGEELWYDEDGLKVFELIEVM